MGAICSCYRERPDSTTVNQVPANPSEDVEHIRLERLTKPQNLSAPSGAAGQPSPPASNTSSPPSKPVPARSPVAITKRPVGISPGAGQSSPTKSSSPPSKPVPVRSPAVTAKRPIKTSPVTPPVKSEKKVLPVLDLPEWEHETIGLVLKVTLSRDVAQKSGYEMVWLKHLAEKLEMEESTQPKGIRLNEGIIDRLLITRLKLDPQAISDDLDYLPVLKSLPPNQTTFEYLTGCWKRLNSTRSALPKKGYPPAQVQQAINILEKLRGPVVSYVNLTLHKPDMFPQPAGRSLGTTELVTTLLSLTAPPIPLSPTRISSPNTFTAPDIKLFLQDLARLFELDNEIDGIFGPVVLQLLFHPSLVKPEGLGDTSWRGVINGLEVLVSIKSIAAMITRMEEWNPPHATASTFEKLSLMGPLCSLGTFGKEWSTIAEAYFSEPNEQTRDDVDFSHGTLRGALENLQSSLFRVFNMLVRASPKSREAVLQYFAQVVSLNMKYRGTQVGADTMISDNFLVNLQSVLFRFAEPFIDANYTKMDHIDTLYYVHSSRIDLKYKNRISANEAEALEQAQSDQSMDATPANFISEIFYLTIAMGHYGYLNTIQSYNGLENCHNELQHDLDIANELQHDLDIVNEYNLWIRSPLRVHIEMFKAKTNRLHTQQLVFLAQLLDPELVFHSMNFMNFFSTWLLHQIDPKKLHPIPFAELPLPLEVPMAFKVLPEYFLEDTVDYFLFVVCNAPESFKYADKVELLFFCLTFLNSTWYIKNPLLAKISKILEIGIWGHGYKGNRILKDLLYTHPVALKHLMPTLIHFYVEVGQWDASYQICDTFSAQRNVIYTLELVWVNLTHREAFKTEVLTKKFIPFINLMISNVRYLMDKSLSGLSQICMIQMEMENKAMWKTKPMEYWLGLKKTLQSVQYHAQSYMTLCKSMVTLLKDFTVETKSPFMVPEIVHHLAAMLDNQLDILAGPRCQDLIFKGPEKLKFNLSVILSDTLQIFLNLINQEEFVWAVAADKWSYQKESFRQVADIARRKVLKTETELTELGLFVDKVESSRQKKFLWKFQNPDEFINS